MEKYERGTRSYTMSHIRGKDTKIEVLVRSYLFRRGLRFRKNDKRYPGHPDVVLPKYHTIVFVNGCFWHMHEGCSKHSMPEVECGILAGETVAQPQSRHRPARRIRGLRLACDHRVGVRIDKSRTRRASRTAIRTDCVSFWLPAGGELSPQVTEGRSTSIGLQDHPSTLRAISLQREDNYCSNGNLRPQLPRIASISSIMRMVSA